MQYDLLGHCTEFVVVKFSGLLALHPHTTPPDTHSPSPFLFISISLMNTLQFPATITNVAHSIVLLSVCGHMPKWCAHTHACVCHVCMCV